MQIQDDNPDNSRDSRTYPPQSDVVASNPLKSSARESNSPGAQVDALCLSIRQAARELGSMGVPWGADCDNYADWQRFVPAANFSPESWDRLLLDDTFEATIGRIFAEGRGRVTPQNVVNYRLFRNPPAGQLEWQSRRDAVFALAENPAALDDLSAIFCSLSAASLEQLLIGTDRLGDGQSCSEWYVHAVAATKQVLKTVDGLDETQERHPVLQSPYLAANLKLLREAARDKDGVISRLSAGLGVSKEGVVSMRGEGFLSLIRPFYQLLPATPFRHDPAAALLTASLLIVGGTMAIRGIAAADSAPAYGGYGGAIGAFGGLVTIAGLVSSVILLMSDPMRRPVEVICRQAENDAQLANYFEVLGRLQELVSSAKFVRDCQIPLCRAERLPADNGVLVQAQFLRSIRHPEKRSWTPNSFTLRRGEFAVVTGPNEGGKTELTLSLAGSLWCAQVIGIAAASQFNFTPTLLMHLTPEGDRKDQTEHSRFRIEAEQSHAAAVTTALRSGPVLYFGDELFSSTNEREAAGEAYKQLAFLAALRAKPSIIIATHNRVLASLLVDAKLATPYQLMWRDGNPEYRLAPGIAESSHAADTVRRAGGSVDDLTKLLLGGEGIPPTGDADEFKRLLLRLPEDLR